MDRESFGDNIQVVVRIRPLSDREASVSQKRCVDSTPTLPNTVLLDAKPEAKKFLYDWVAGEGSSQQEIYKRIGEPMADACLQGYNCTIFAYGQTGAGKTYTMQGKGLLENYNGSFEAAKGLQPRVLESLFHKVRSAVQEGTEVLVKCSYFEIYNEQIIDLLNPSAGTLVAREDMKKGTFVEGLTEDTVSSCTEAVNVLVKGARNRHVGSTDMNLESSRSHSVFLMCIEQKRMKDGVINVVSSKINFVDLAGSERQKATNTSGDRLKEAGNINKSLTVLGSVINSLVEISEGKKTHVRYRDSKLTFLLKDSLGGNSKTAIIANVSPSTDSFGETLSTLKFAQRAKLIKNRASINEETSGCIEGLKNEIIRLKGLLSGSATDHTSKNNQLASETRVVPTFEQECQIIQECNSSQHELQKFLNESLEILNETDKKLQQEYLKKEEFRKIFQTACSMYENKEHHMQLMLRILQNKSDRMLKGQWEKEDEIESLRALVESLQSTTTSVPTIMQVFQENLKLKDQITYANVNGCPSANMLKVMNLLRHNMTFMENLNTKLAEGTQTSAKLNSKFEKLCLMRGMTAEEISSINTAMENDDLKKEKEALCLQLIDKQQTEENLKTLLDHEQTKSQEMRDELNKQKSEYQSEIENLEKRINELNESYNSIQEQGSIASSAFQNREVQLKDQVSSLTLKRSELLKKLDRVEETLTLEKKNHEQQLQAIESQMSQLKLNCMRLQEEITMKKTSNSKLKEENQVLKNEIESLGQRLKTESISKENLVSKYNTLNSELEHMKVTTMKESDAIQRMREEMDDLESEKNQISSEKLVLKEELDTLQQSLEYIKGQLEEKNKSIEQLEAEKQRFETNERNREASIKNLEEELEKQTQSNSPYNIAIKENHSLRTMVRELRLEIDNIEKKRVKDGDSRATLEGLIASLRESEAYYRTALKEANQDTQKKHSDLKELKNIIIQNDEEIEELNHTITSLMVEQDSKTQKLNQAYDTIESLKNDIQELKARLNFTKVDQQKLLASRLDEIHAEKNKASEWELKYITMKQEYDGLREYSEREIHHLSSTLNSVNEQNKHLIQERIGKEEEFKKSKLTLLQEVSSLNFIVKEYQLTMNGLEQSQIIDQVQVENLRSQVKQNVDSDKEQLNRLMAENSQLKAEVANQKSKIFQLYSKLDHMHKTFTSQMMIIKDNSRRLDNQYKAAYQSFKVMEEDLIRTKDELRFINLDRTNLAQELSQLKFDSGLVSSKYEDTMARLDVYKKQVTLLKQDNDLLNAINDDVAGQNAKQLKEDRVVIYKNENERLRKMILSGNFTQLKKLNSQAVEVEDEDEALMAFATDEVRELVKSIIQKTAFIGNCKGKKLSKKADVTTLLQNLEKHIDAFSEEERAYKAQGHRAETNLQRYKLLESENSYLKQKLNFCTGFTKETNQPDNFINKKPSYTTTKDQQDKISSLSGLKQALMAFPLQNTSNLPVSNLAFTPSASNKKVKVPKTPGESHNLGKRYLPQIGEERNENDPLGFKMNLHQSINAVCMSPKSKRKDRTSSKRLTQSMIDEFFAADQSSQGSPKGHHQISNTPKKKIKVQ